MTWSFPDSDEKEQRGVLISP